MVLPGDDEDCGDCKPSYLTVQQQHSPFAPVHTLFSCAPFIATFFIVGFLVLRRLYPLVSGEQQLRTHDEPRGQHTTTNGPRHSATFKPALHVLDDNVDDISNASPLRRSTSLIFSATLALSVVLAELILCEIANVFDPVARSIALRSTILLLVVLLVVVIPSLEIDSVLGGSKYDVRRSKSRWILRFAAFGLWGFAFWSSGQVMHNHTDANEIMGRGGSAYNGGREGLVNAATERVGIIGISLMALLSGFASVSAAWQSFIARPRPVSDASVARKRAGLASTNEMLATKRSRLRALDRKMNESGSSGRQGSSGQPGSAGTGGKESFLSKAIGSFRSNSDQAERRSLEIEVAGLEHMALALSTSHAALSSRLAAQRRSRTPAGRLLYAGSLLFATYCVYRIAAAGLTFVRRRYHYYHLLNASSDDQAHHAQHPFIGSDPINTILAVLIKHYDSHLDRALAARQISFLLSGAMLAASLSSALQTLRLLARLAPAALLRAVVPSAVAPLLVAQICGTYVIAVALLLRGVVLSGASSAAVGEHPLRDLGGRDLLWVDSWFEGWFLIGVVATAIGVWLGGKIRKLTDWDDDEDDPDVEAGKMS